MHKRKSEAVWQAIDTAVILAVACTVTALLTHDIKASALLFAFALASVTVYLLIELKLEHARLSLNHLMKQHRTATAQSRANLLLWGVVIGGLTSANFYLFFTRHGVSASTVPGTAPLYKDAVALMGMTMALCLLARILHHRYHFSKQLELTGIHYARHLKAYVLSFLYTFAAMYCVLLLVPDYSVNIGFAVLAAGLFVSVCEFQRYDRQHHRGAIHALHLKNAQARS